MVDEVAKLAFQIKCHSLWRWRRKPWGWWKETSHTHCYFQKKLSVVNHECLAFTCEDGELRWQDKWQKIFVVADIEAETPRWQSVSCRLLFFFSIPWTWWIYVLMGRAQIFNWRSLHQWGASRHQITSMVRFIFLMLITFLAVIMIS